MTQVSEKRYVTLDIDLLDDHINGSSERKIILDIVWNFLSPVKNTIQ